MSIQIKILKWTPSPNRNWCKFDAPMRNAVENIINPLASMNVLFNRCKSVMAISSVFLSPILLSEAIRCVPYPFTTPHYVNLLFTTVHSTFANSNFNLVNMIRNTFSCFTWQHECCCVFSNSQNFHRAFKSNTSEITFSYIANIQTHTILYIIIGPKQLPTNLKLTVKSQRANKTNLLNISARC